MDYRVTDACTLIIQGDISAARKRLYLKVTAWSQSEKDALKAAVQQCNDTYGLRNSLDWRDFIG